ncbi:hypothetical protein RCL1_006932 [Eukaryota sp. TZLM3-RCL]
MAPITTGTSVLALKFKDGVLLACDTLASYGSLARFPHVQRLRSIGDNTLIASSGDFADFQMLMDFFEQEVLLEQSLEDGYVRSPSEYHQLLTRVLYNKRLKMQPWWLQCVFVGFHQDKSFLASTDLRGTHFEDDYAATGYGSYLATPLFRKYWRPDMTLDEAKNLLLECVKVIIARDGRTHSRWQFGMITAAGTGIDEPTEIDISWRIAQ